MDKTKNSIYVYIYIYINHRTMDKAKKLKMGVANIIKHLFKKKVFKKCQYTSLKKIKSKDKRNKKR